MLEDPFWWTFLKMQQAFFVLIKTHCLVMWNVGIAFDYMQQLR